MTYPVLSDYTYLNTAASGLISKELYDLRRQWDADFLHTGSLFRDPIYDQVKRVRESVRHFLNAEGNSVSIIPSLSYGLNIALEDAQFDKNVLTIEDDYPSLVWPFMSRGYATDEMILKENWSLDSILETISRLKPVAFAYSPVLYQTGHYISESWMKEIRTQFPELLLIMDGTQYIGTSPFSMNGLGIDLVVGSGYKWIGSGYGNAYIALSPRMQERLHTPAVGYNTIKRHDYEAAKSVQGRLEPGHQDTLALLSLEHAVHELQSLGLENIQDHTKRMYSIVNDRLLEMNDCVMDEGFAPHIVSISGTLEDVEALSKHKIVCSYRENIRMSYHHYNSAEDIHRFFDILNDLRQ